MDRCAWCNEPEDEHGGFGVGCEDGFIPIDWRTRAHAILDNIIDGASTSSFAVGDSQWLLRTLRLRGAVVRAQEEKGERA